MSTAICIFGVPPKTEAQQIFARCTQLFAARPPRAVYVALQAEGAVRKRRWFQLLVDPAWDRALLPVAEQLAAGFAELTVLLRSDGRAVFRHYAGGAVPRLALRSEGPHVELLAGTIAGIYPQLLFTRDELAALQGKPEAEMTESERHAVFHARDAVRLGLEELFRGEGEEFLAPGAAQQIFALVEGGAVVTPRAADAAGLPATLHRLPTGVGD